MTDSSRVLKLVSRRMPFYHENVPFIVCWAQKAGCTTILKWFLYHAGLLNEAMQYPPNPGSVRSIHKFEIEAFKARPGYTDELVENLRSNYPIVNFVRCPYERAFSSYMAIHNPNLAVYPDWQTPYQKIRRNILDGLYGSSVSIEYPLSFQDYLVWLNGQNLETLDPHHRPQFNPLFDVLPVTHFRLDEFASVSAALEKKYNLGSSIALSNGTYSSEHHVDKTALSKKSTMEFLTKGMPVSRSEKFFTPSVTRDILEGSELGDMVELLFPRDMDLYDQTSTIE
jgi:hypothetical protein